MYHTYPVGRRRAEREREGRVRVDERDARTPVRRHEHHTTRSILHRDARRGLKSLIIRFTFEGTRMGTHTAIRSVAFPLAPRRGLDAAPPPKTTPTPPLADRRRFPELPDASPSPGDAPVSCGVPGAKGTSSARRRSRSPRVLRPPRRRTRRGFRRGHERAVSSLERRRGHRPAAQR